MTRRDADGSPEPRFFYLIPALSRRRFSYESSWAHFRRVLRGSRGQVPSGGVKIIYQHCDLLNKNSFRAFPVHLGDFTIDWFPHESTPVSRQQALEMIREQDVLVCPEVIPRAAWPFACGHKIIFVQNWFLPDIATGPDKSYEDFGSSGLLACSQYIQEYMAGRSRLSCRVVTNGIDLAAFSPAPQQRIPLRVLCFNRRNIQDARDAIQLLPPSVRQSATFVELENRYTQQQVIDFYRSADIFMAIGYPEGFALPPLEAMACGCAVVGFTGGGASEFMLDGETALIAADGDAQELARCLERVLTDAELREKLRSAGTARAQRYSLQRMEQELLSFAKSFSAPALKRKPATPSAQPLKVLAVIEQCNPQWASVPLVGYNIYRALRQRADVTLVTHERNREALEPVRDGHRIVYISESPFIKRYYRITSLLSERRGVIWPLKHALAYPAYAEFNRAVHKLFGKRVSQGDYDIVHALTPILPRYPYALVNDCCTTPFILGPVNGGIPFPEGFGDVARSEFSGLNVLRIFSRLLPDYARSYKNAACVLAGSRYTRDMLQQMFALPAENMVLMPENGLTKNFLGLAGGKAEAELLRLLFVGRLVPYKGADMVIEALGRLDPAVRSRCRLTIVGDGPERRRLEALAQKIQVFSQITFTGWVPQNETAAYYRGADLFCFPSVREFGGAVVLEAMACGLPCIVADHGGIAEYTTEETGFKINPVSRESVVHELAGHIAALFHDRERLHGMSAAAMKQARSFSWDAKAEQLLDVYYQVLQEKKDGAHAVP
jgi:glycosyltransferase involved in cell wall biosynthesis